MDEIYKVQEVVGSIDRTDYKNGGVKVFAVLGAYYDAQPGFLVLEGSIAFEDELEDYPVPGEFLRVRRCSNRFSAIRESVRESDAWLVQLRRELATYNDRVARGEARLPAYPNCGNGLVEASP